MFSKEIPKHFPLLQFASMVCCLRNNVPYLVWLFFLMFLKHFGDSLFQTTTGFNTLQPSAATKNAAVKHCLDVLPPLQLLNFWTRLFSDKALKNNPNLAMFQIFFNSWPVASLDKRSIHDWIVICGMLSTLSMIRLSQISCTSLNFSNQLFNVVKELKSSLFNLSFISIGSSFSMAGGENIKINKSAKTK